VEEDIDQQEVDRLFGIIRRGDSVAAGLPKGRSSPTAEPIVEILRESNDSLSAVDVAERVGISRATAQRYLSSLAQAELVRLELNYGSTGRPEHGYRLELR
jgi:response regulator of citrate/malate metabolism